MKKMRFYLRIRSYLQRIFLIHDFRPNIPDLEDQPDYLEEVVDSFLSESDLEVSVSIVVLDDMGESTR